MDKYFKYKLGAVLYTPSTRSIDLVDLVSRFGLRTSVICFEDSIKRSQVNVAECNLINLLKMNVDNVDKLPFIFIRVRNFKQFKSIYEKVEPEGLRLLSGFVFPKITKENIGKYMRLLNEINIKHGVNLYAMPIIESEKVIRIKNRMKNLLEIKKILDKNKNLILNVRIGGSDISSFYRTRRLPGNTIYDLICVNNCISDIYDVFGQDYVISGCVYDDFSENNRHIFEKEIEMDIQNGFFNKTIIHPSHIKIVNDLYKVSIEEYEDAIQILNSNNPVCKSKSLDRMNEYKVHRNWANLIIIRKNIYGLKNEDN